ncbi:MAG: hypothetical protein AAF843_19375, partial [Bacteroidota bacterium]
GMIDSLQDVKTILRVNIEDLNSLPFNLGADFLLVHSKSALNLLQIQEIQKRVDRIKVLLDCDIQASSVLGLIEETKAYGISLTAGHEIRPGYKDYDELADILEILETDD